MSTMLSAAARVRKFLAAAFGLRALACVFVLLAQPLHSLAQETDETNAAKVDAPTWGNMDQVMGGTSRKTPDGSILSPQGLYVIVFAADLYTKALAANPTQPDQALTLYFGWLLDQPGVAGLVFSAPWSSLNPNDPSDTTVIDSTATCPGTSTYNPAAVYVWNFLDDAFCAIETWNTNNKTAPPKTLQLIVNPGFNSPAWLFDHLSTCDFVFATPLKLPSTNPSGCGYTNVFLATESGTPTALPLPLPWNSTYKTDWQTFLEKLDDHIKSQKADSYVVSIAVAGPTASSAEMILPNSASDITSSYRALSGTANAAWNCLLANHYGAMPISGASYLNSDRAFIEEWAEAIDMYGKVFKGITLVATTGNGLPDFSNEAGGSVPACALGVSAPIPSTTSAPQAFLADCDAPPSPALRRMDCVAETAILAYFAEPSVGGPNAKATEEDALAAGDDLDGSLLTLSNASVKWLSQLTAGGLAPVTGNPMTPKSMPVMSRMLGGLQFAKSPSLAKNTAFEGCPYRACQSCIVVSSPPICVPPIGINCAPESGTDCTPLSSTGAPVEQALLNVLREYFAGTSGPGTRIFDASLTVKNNTALSVSNAPMNYLQVWDSDIQYAAGYGGCPVQDLMTSPPTACSAYTPPGSMPKVCISPLECGLGAQGLLAAAGANIPTTDPVLLPLFGYNNGLSRVCSCKLPYVPRGAFDGDDVCVSTTDQSDAATENANYAEHYSDNETKTSKSVPWERMSGVRRTWAITFA
jgi:hypothetical protein